VKPAARLDSARRPTAGQVLIRNASRWLERILESFTILLLLGLTGIILAAVLFRTLGHSLLWYDELASVLLAWLTFFGASLAGLKRLHMGFPGLMNAARPALRRTFFCVSEFVTIGFFLLVAYFGHDVLVVLAFDRMISLPALTLDVTQSVIPISAALCVLAQILSLPGAWQAMEEGRNAAQLPGDDGDEPAGDPGKARP
jgi:TRAP-type C4-dicarboxylate transport system permease small subunit